MRSWDVGSNKLIVVCGSLLRDWAGKVVFRVYKRAGRYPFGLLINYSLINYSDSQQSRPHKTNNSRYPHIFPVSSSTMLETAILDLMDRFPSHQHFYFCLGVALLALYIIFWERKHPATRLISFSEPEDHMLKNAWVFANF